MEGFSGEILSKTAKHARNTSETNLDPPKAEAASPASEFQKRFINMIKIPFPSPSPSPPISPDSLPQAPLVFSRPHHYLSTNQRTTSHGSKPTPVHYFSLSTKPSYRVHSLKDIIFQHVFCIEEKVLSPTLKLVESAYRRSILSSTCSIERNLQKSNADDWQLKERVLKAHELNVKEQRIKIGKILSGKIRTNAKIVLSGPSNILVFLGTSSMVAAICYEWLLENRMKADKERGEGDRSSFELIIPVMNTQREKMWKQCQAAWLFDHVGLDATALFFSNELAGILLDTQNLNLSPKLSVTRDVEAVQPSSIGFGRKKTSNEITASIGGDKYQNDIKDAPVKKVSPISGKPTTPPLLPQTKAPAKEIDASRGKNKNFAKMFSFGSKNMLLLDPLEVNELNQVIPMLLNIQSRPPSRHTRELSTTCTARNTSIADPEFSH
ncbi:uncharacterized protein Fot_29535 [Forsythia ovata]|uniref:Uncharacterized protein n=1 Tax=Forsythia ovata TaxID=205694 RepID=A0ABD1TS58_9LAMI